MDRQDGQDTGLEHGQITRKVIGCAFAVIHELGAGFLDSVYEKALLLALRKEGSSMCITWLVKYTSCDRLSSPMNLDSFA